MDVFRKIFEEYKKQKQSGKSDYLFRTLTYYSDKIVSKENKSLIELLEYLCNRCDWLIGEFEKERGTKYVPTIEDLQNLISSDYIPKYATEVWNDIYQCIEENKLTPTANKILMEWYHSKKHESFFDIDLIKEFRDAIKKEIEGGIDFEAFKKEDTKWKKTKVKEHIRDFLPENLEDRELIALKLDDSLRNAKDIGDATRKIMDCGIDLKNITKTILCQFLESHYNLGGGYSSMTDNVRNHRKR